MKSTTTASSVASNQQETYTRTRDDPFFDGMRRGEAAVVNKGSAFDFQGKLSKNNINRPSSDIGDPGSKNISITVTEDVIYSPKNSPSDIVLEPIGRSLSGRWSKTSSPLALLESDLSNFHDMNEPSTVSAPDGSESKEQSTTQSGTARPAIQSYSMSKRQTDISNVHLPHSAALFYCGSSPQMEVVESCGSIYKLNVYLKARRADVNAGVPGRFLRAVIGPDIADVGSVVSTIMYAFYLDETLGSNEFCTVPVINMKRADLGLHADLQWLIFSCHIDLSSLIFVDELAGILLDTENLSRSQCTSKDKYMATLLINGAGRFGCNGLYQILKHKTSGSSDLTVEEILRKEFKKWTRSGKPNTSSSRLLAPNVGMSSIGMSVAQLLSYNSTTIQEIIHFQKLEKLGLLLVVSGYYDSQKKFKREVLLSAGSAEVMKSLLLFLNSNAALLPLKALDQPGLEHEMRVFEIDKVTSRRTIERLLEEFLPHLNNSL